MSGQDGHQRTIIVVWGAALSVLLTLLPGAVARADFIVPIAGAGSTWAANAASTWAANVHIQGQTVNYAPTGNLDGLKQFTNRTSDFALTDYPYGATASLPTTDRKFAAVPILAGSTDLEYNLKIGGRPVTNLRLSGAVVVAIFTRAVTNWDDPAIAADNPGLTLPDLAITPVVRSDVSGTTLQFTSWLNAVAPEQWQAYCARGGDSGSCPTTARFPVSRGMNAQAGSLGVSGFVAQSSSLGAITYVEHSYPVNLGMPSAKVLNRAGYYTAPTPSSVGIALLQANAQADPSAPGYPGPILTGVYNAIDPRAYPLSGYGYLILPTELGPGLTEPKAAALLRFGHYGLCDGQAITAQLGYSTLPVNLVQAGLDQLARIPGADSSTLTLADCAGSTFGPDGEDLLTTSTPTPAACDQIGQRVCGSNEEPDPDDPDAPGDGETLTTTVEPGTLIITADPDVVDLGTATLAADNLMLSTAPADLHPIRVTDTRAGDLGYSVTGAVTDFTSAAGARINAANLGWTPRILSEPASQAVTAGPAIPPAVNPVAVGATSTEGLWAARTLALAPAGGGVGTAVLTASLVLHAPTSTMPGNYQTTLTVTVI